MKETPAIEHLEQWLDIATHGLPANIVPALRCELKAHYQDALEAHLQDGSILYQARQAALAELGSAVQVSEQLQTIYLSRRQSLAAMLACMIYPFLLLVLPSLISGIGALLGYLVHDLINTIVLVFVLTAFIRLIGFNSSRLNLPTKLLIFGILLGTVTRLAYFIIFSRLPLAGPDNQVYWEKASATGMILDIAFIAAEGIAAVAAAWLGMRLYRLGNMLFGLLRPVSILIILTCPIGLGVSIALMLSSMTVASYLSTFGYVIVTTLLAIMTLIFFRATFRTTENPLKAA